MKRNLAALGGGTAAGVNAGTLVNQSDKIIHLDPTNEILYDPAENIRNGKVVDDSVDGLIDLRLTIEGSKQLQPIRVYPLPQNKLDPSKPALKYGIAVGHRRTLCSRLTSADHPAISDLPRKVAAIIDTDWLKKGRAYQLRCQIHENTARVDLNPVELGQALLDYKRELSNEEKRVVPQHELMEVYGLPEKTVYLLLKAAEFHQIAKDACHLKLLTDLDSLNTFDLTCKANEQLGQAIFESLKVEGAPSTRILLRQARTLAESDGYEFDKASWSWPATVEAVGSKPAANTPANQPANSGQHNPGTPAPSNVPSTPTGAGSNNQGSAAGAGENAASNAGSAVTDQQGSGALDSQTGKQQPGSSNTQSAENNGQSALAPASSSTAGASQLAGGAKEPAEQAPLDESPAAGVAGAAKGAIIMVEFKMGADAKKDFTGELILNKKAKSPSMGVVAYLNDEGREEFIDVPLKLMNLVSINHQ
ncbi:hypothetical protein [Pseudomonas savastanoi]|uniref:hypothetical protein n=1 Tax=Pseudomonas savastanoi TaxID=29438 RepID=UPI000E329F40|nr:hypothetical protein [Pseudomonas savastanoi]